MNADPASSRKLVYTLLITATSTDQNPNAQRLAAYIRHIADTAPPIGVWFHVTFATDGSSVSIAYDGVQAGTLGGLGSFGGSETLCFVRIP